MRSVNYKLICSLFLILAAGCVEPYLPPDGIGVGGQMVVDGFINASDKSVMVKLSRALTLADANVTPPETKATVKIVSSSGTEILLTESDNENRLGTYAASNLSLDPLAEYKLQVVTQSGSSFSSDYIKLRTSPAIDSLVWRPSDSGITFYVNSHDSENETRYYRWNYLETYEYYVPYISIFKKVGNLPVPRDSGEYVYRCWGTSPSTTILVESTTRLAQDIVSMFPVHTIRKGDRKLMRKARLIVQQHAISSDEFEFWQLIRKTTETLGGLFDPMPSQVLGNIHSDDNENEHVLGFFGGGFVTEKRIYVGLSDLPPELNTVDPSTLSCGDGGRAVPFAEVPSGVDANEVYVATYGNPVTLGYTVSSNSCADCTSYGGTNSRPPDWPIF